MLYEYQARDGDRITVDLPMEDAPPFGHEIRRNGKAYRRIPSQVPATHLAVRSNLRLESRVRCRWDPFHKGDFSPDGKPRLTSHEEAKELAKRDDGETGSGATYGEMAAASEETGRKRKRI